jgi:hypothetical protein
MNCFDAKLLYIVNGFRDVLNNKIMPVTGLNLAFTIWLLSPGSWL